MRNIKEFSRTTPSYTYNVNDAVGIDLDRFAIGMSIKLGNYTCYALPRLETQHIFDLTPSAEVGVFESNAYSTHVDGTNSFTVTFPLWRIPSGVADSEGTYQIFLFRVDTGSTLNTTEDGTTQPATISPNNVVLDYGGFTILESLVPPLKDSAKRGVTLAFA